jgi:flagellin-like hook-associated protein FlgL
MAATGEHTNLGNRMRRVEMFEVRLEQDEGNYFKLMSENEDVDMTMAITRQAIAEAAFQGALRIIANNVQLSLVNFV